MFVNDSMLSPQEWFAAQYERAHEQFTKSGFRTYMEIKFSLQNRKKHFDQQKLTEAVEKSQIHTFGWPIGIIMESDEQFRPKPADNGIYLEGKTERKDIYKGTYDYWAFNCNGDFYQLKSIYEDTKNTIAIFFNTRIVRVAETLLFCEKLYSNLGLADENPWVDIEINYFGLKGRLLRSSNFTRHIERRFTDENEVRTKGTVSIDWISPKIIELTEQFAWPLFVVYEHCGIDYEIYEDIVTDFIHGKVT